MSDNKNNTILRVNNLVKHFPIRGGLLRRIEGWVSAVDGVSFEIKVGETLSLVGESGCGKTTTARLIVKAMKQTSGNIFIKHNGDMLDLTRINRQEIRDFRKNVQIVYQDPFSSLNPRMTILDIIGEPLTAMKMASRKEIVERVRELLPRVGLKEQYMNRYPHAFSGGQRQRIGMARALAPGPRLIVADEPVSALDVSVQAQILNLMLDLQQEFDFSYLFISHDLSVVKHISDRVGVMYVGKIVEMTSALKLFERPFHPYTEALLSAIPKPVPGAKKNEILLRGDIADASSVPPGCRFHPRCRYAKAVCGKEEPELRNLGTKGIEHLVACHRAEELTLRGE